MKKTLSVTHQTKNYTTNITLQEDVISCLLTVHMGHIHKVFEGNIIYQSIPDEIKKITGDMKSMFWLFEDEENFLVQETKGIINIILRTTVGKKTIEQMIPFKFDEVDLKDDEVASLKKEIKYLRNKIEKLEAEKPSNTQTISVTNQEIKMYKAKTIYQEEESFETQNEIYVKPISFSSKTQELEEEEDMDYEGQIIPQALNLSFQQLGDEGIEFLVDDKWSARLTQLNLGLNNISERGMRTLGQGSWKNLRTLSLDGNKIGDEGVKHLKKYQNLRKLYLERCGLSSEGVMILSNIGFSKLEELDLDGNKIGDEGIQWLAPFTKLSRLSLPSTKITVKGVLEITRLHLNKLKHLVLNQDEIGKEGRKIISKFGMDRGIQITY